MKDAIVSLSHCSVEFDNVSNLVWHAVLLENALKDVLKGVQYFCQRHEMCNPTHESYTIGTIYGVYIYGGSVRLFGHQ